MQHDSHFVRVTSPSRMIQHCNILNQGAVSLVQTNQQARRVRRDIKSYDEALQKYGKGEGQ